MFAGFIQPRKLYAVYYGGTSNYACGSASWPPALIGYVAAIYLRGQDERGGPRCETVRFSSSVDTPGYHEFGMLHEILHTLGVVARCAPHHTFSGHVSDDPQDLMYAGSQDWRPSLLDVGRDDYFEHNNPGCLDLAKSIFLDPAVPDAVPPPGW